MNDKYRIYGMQEYLIHLTEGEDTCVVNPAGLKIHGALDTAKLEQVMQKMTEQNDALRFVFERDDKTHKLYQRVLEQYHCKLKIKKLDGESKKEQTKNLIEDVQTAMRKVSYLPDGQVKWDVILYQYEQDEYELWVLANHVISDGLSVMNILTKIVMGYNDMPMAQSGQYLDYIKEQYLIEEDEQLERKRSAYKETIADYKNPIKTDGIGHREDPYRAIAMIDTTKLKTFTREYKMSLFHAALFLTHAALSATFDTADSLIGVAVGNRKLNNMLSIGDFLTGYADRLIFGENDSMRQMAVQCKRQYLEESKSDYAAYNCFGKGLLFMIAYQNYAGEEPEITFGDAKAEPIEDYSAYMVSYPWKSLCIDIYEMPQGLALMGGYDSSIFTDEVMLRLNTAFNVAAKCLTDCDVTYREYCALVDEAMTQTEVSA
ncbi:MAG: hypothetical protein K6G01_06825 [Eubacterium sp.]|nr:hypothetical protein [Eubacterium sp.]